MHTDVNIVRLAPLVPVPPVIEPISLEAIKCITTLHQLTQKLSSSIVPCERASGGTLRPRIEAYAPVDWSWLKNVSCISGMLLFIGKERKFLIAPFDPCNPTAFILIWSFWSGGCRPTWYMLWRGLLGLKGVVVNTTNCLLLMNFMKL